MNTSLTMFMLFLVTLLAACRNPESVLQIQTPADHSGMFIVNEGGFAGGGSLSFYDAQHDTLYNNIAGINEHWIFPNDMKIAGSKGYVAVEGLDRIDLIDLATYQVSGSITLPTSSGPEFLSANDSLLCSANANGTVSVIRLSDDSVTWTSPSVVGFPGGIILLGSRIAVMDAGLYPRAGQFIKILDPIAKTVVDSLSTGGSPGPVAAVNEKIYVVLTSGSAILQINLLTRTVEDSMGLPGYYSDLTTDGQSLFALTSDSVAKISVAPLRLVNSSFVKRTTGIYFYSLGADPGTGDLYVSNIMTSIGAGELELYNSTGRSQRTPAATGTFPGAFDWKP